MNEVIPLDDKTDIIAGWDFSDVVYRLVHRDGLPESDVLLAVEEFRKYMKLRYYTNVEAMAMPSEFVDKVWHQFILFTPEYHEFCNAVFGRYIHHRPATRARRPDQASMELFYSNYQKHFGPAPSIWRTKSLSPSQDCDSVSE